MIKAGVAGGALLTAASGKAALAAQTSQPKPEGQAVPKPTFVLDVAEGTINAAGVSFKGPLSGNTFPGTPLRFTEGDTFRVLVNNRLAEPTCIHWHGLLLPSLLDGVPEIAQLPIEPNTSQYYEFPLVQQGTYYYHSHFGVQEQYGLLGSLIIDAKENPYSYDREEVVMLNDIIAQDGAEVIKELRTKEMRADAPDPYLAKGQGRFDIDVHYDGYTINGKSNDAPWTLKAKKGERIRLRIINGSGSSFFRIKIDGIPMTVIESDGNRVEPIEADDLMIGTSERYDVLIEIPESGSFGFHAAVLGDNRQALGVIHSEDVKPEVSDAPVKFSGNSVSYRDLRAFEKRPFIQGAPRNHDVILSGNMKAYEWMMNEHYWPEPFALPGATKTYLDVSEGELVRLRMINRSPMYHPMHLHGHTFKVMGLADDEESAPIKDSIWVAPRSTVEIAFYADNPGMWAYHCHNIWHLAVGMMQPVRYVPPSV
nr:multicopper oxidase family protein [Pseudovibrio flavus]